MQSTYGIKMIIQTQADADAFAHLTIALIRILIAKNVIEKEDIMADLYRQKAPGEIVYAINKLLDITPCQ